MMIYQWTMIRKLRRRVQNNYYTFVYRKNMEAFDKETRNDNIDISDVDVSADLFGKIRFSIKIIF